VTRSAELNERRDVRSAGIWLAGLCLLAMLAVALGALWLIFAPQASGPAIGFARPDPAVDLAQFEASETRKLTSLGWSNRAAGLARIPIADAMSIMAAQGRLPQWPAGKAP